MGYLNIDRKLFNHFLWTERRSFSKFEAWIDLIQLVSYDDNNSEIINGTHIKWGRGQFPVSYSFLADRWLWSTNRVRGYIRLLKNNKQIDTKSTNVITILTLCNYEQYNTVPQAKRQAKRQADGQPEGQADNKPTAGIKLIEQSNQVIYSDFYDSELKKTNDPQYLNFVKFLFKENGTDRPFIHVLKLGDQIGYEQFKKIKLVAEENGTRIYDKVRSLENRKAKGYSSFYLTLNEWLKHKFERADVR
jgi:hypothetical protein